MTCFPSKRQVSCEASLSSGLDAFLSRISFRRKITYEFANVLMKHNRQFHTIAHINERIQK